MLCCFFWGPVLYKTENNTSYKATNEQTKTMKWLLAMIPSCASTRESLWTLNIKDEEWRDCTLSDIAVFLFFCSFCLFYYRPFSFDSMKQRGRGSGFTLCMVGAHCPSNKSLKCSSGLQLFSISNRSNEQQYGLNLFLSFNYVLYFLPFFFLLLFFDWMVIG